MLRNTLIILVAAAAGLGAAMFLWPSLLHPALAVLPPAPTVRQRQFGMRIRPAMADALERPLTTEIKPGTFDDTLRAAAEQAGVDLFINWRAVERVGMTRQSRVTITVPAGKKFGDAVLAVLAHQPTKFGKLACAADENVLTVSTADEVATDAITRVYDCRDLARTTAEHDALIAQTRAAVAPTIWRDNGGSIGSIHYLSGQWIVTADYFTQYDLVQHLNDIRSRRAHLALAGRAAALSSTAIVVALLAILIRHFRALARRSRRGLCTVCGYDLRASADRCPECGTMIA
jgi:hypothetical protein